jgi:2-polyprenyl-3-methyl-5-hydroxy-6-metoxy-1,4-benzoquinol methylase
MSDLSREQIAAGYDAIAEEIFESDSLYEDTLQLVGQCHGRVLDVGCGQGVFLSRLLGKYPNISEAAGCDISPRLCSMARASVPRATIREEDAQTLQAYPSGHFDLVTMVGSLEHVQDHAAALRAAFRVLQPGGIYVVVVPNRAWLRYDRWLALHTQEQPVDDHWFTPEELRRVVEQAGFTVESVRGIWALFRGDWRHRLELMAAAVVPQLHYKMKCIGFRCRKPA